MIQESESPTRCTCRWARRTFIVLGLTGAVVGTLLLMRALVPTGSSEPELPSEGPGNPSLEPFSPRGERADLPVPPLFEGYSIAKKEQPKADAEGKYTAMFSIDEERSSDLKGVRDLDYIRDNLKMIAEYDTEHHYVYSRIANTGEHDIVFNEYWLGYFESVTLECDGKVIPRDSHEDAMRAMQGIGPHLHANITLPSRAMYQSHEANYWWLRFGPPKRIPSDPKVRIFQLTTARPRKGEGISFRDDLLDFDWTDIESDQVEVVLVQRLANVLPTERNRSWETFEIRSNPMSVDVNALKTYKQRLTRFHDELHEQSAGETRGR